MNKNQTDKSNLKTESMLKEKTNEDYNKQKPNPKDPNQNKNLKADADVEKKKREVTAKPLDKTKNSQKS